MKVISFHPYFKEIAIHIESQLSFLPDSVVAILAYNQATKDEFDKIRNQYEKVILFQFEQLWIGSYWIDERFHYMIPRSDLVVEYDIDNVDILKKLGYNNFVYSPLLYSMPLDKSDIYSKTACDIDILFCGSITGDRAERMNNFLINLTSSGYHAVCYFGPLDERYYELVSRSRIMLNTHHFHVKRQQQARLFPLISSGKMILSEESTRNIYGEAVVESYHQQDLIDKFVHYIHNRRWYDQGMNGREHLMKITNYTETNEAIYNALYK